MGPSSGGRGRHGIKSIRRRFNAGIDGNISIDGSGADVLKIKKYLPN